MRLTFLGGADEVGASSTLVEVAQRRVLVDCGVRMKEDNPLPLIGLLNDLKLHACVLTHAHADHLGAMPIVATTHPHIPIFMTAATLRIATVMLQDALKIMALRHAEGGPPPLYDMRAVEAFMSAVHIVPFNQPFQLIPDELHAMLTPAGHILGAACLTLESRMGTALLTGDVSVDDQVTIPGMTPIKGVRPDIVVVESTYGGRKHSERPAEVKRLVRQTAKVLERGGRVLFPAFAIGRAQEVILILSRAMEQGHLPRVPIHVDGLVRQICQCFTIFPELLTPWLRRRVQKHGNPFFFPDGPAQAIWDPRDRDKLLSNGPAVVVASSGMLTGGPSQLYARQLAKDPNSLIAITGYQDEESPGRAIQNLARQGGGQLRLGDGVVDLKCEVGTYSLSAHADTAQLVAAVAPLRPQRVALVHGDHGARAALRKALLAAGVSQVERPAAGDTLEVQGRPGRTLGGQYRKRREADSAAAPRPALDVEALPKLAEELLKRDTKNQAYTAQELLCCWRDLGGDDSLPLPSLVATLKADGSPFKSDKKRSFLYRLRVDNDGNIVLKGQPRPPRQRKATEPERLEVAMVIAELFGDDMNLHTCKYRLPQRLVVFHFNFPKIALEQHADTLQEVTERTGWRTKVRPEANQSRLIEVATELTPQGWRVRKTPSVHLDRQELVVKISATDKALLKGPAPSSHATIVLRAVEAHFERLTGFKLSFKVVVEQQSGTVTSKAVTSRVVTSAGGQRQPMEMNQAYATIKEAFEAAPHKLYKVGIKNNAYIELAFVSPQIGARYADKLKALEAQLAWPLRVKEHANQHVIKQLAQDIVPGPLRGGVSYHEAQGRVVVTPASPISPQARQEAKRRFLDLTGFELHFK